MAASLITITQSSSTSAGGTSRDDIVISSLVTLANANDSNVRSWRWVLVERPRDSAAVLSNVTAPSPTFTPDVNGSYLIQLQVNGGSAVGETNRVLVAVRNTAVITGGLITATRFVAASETDEANWSVDLGPGPAPNTTGWWEDLDRTARLTQALAEKGQGAFIFSTIATGTGFFPIHVMVSGQVATTKVRAAISDPLVTDSVAVRYYEAAFRHDGAAVIALGAATEDSGISNILPAHPAAPSIVGFGSGDILLIFATGSATVALDWQITYEVTVR